MIIINRFYNPEPKRLDSEKLSEQVSVEEGHIVCGGRKFRVVIKENGKEVLTYSPELQQKIAKKVARMINEAGFKETPDLSKVQVNRSGFTVGSRLPHFINWLFSFILNQKYTPRNEKRFGELFEKVSKGNFEKAEKTEKTEKERKIIADVKAKSENPDIKKARVLHNRFGNEFKDVKLDKKSNSVSTTPIQLRRAVELVKANFTDTQIQNWSNEEAHQLVNVILCGKEALRVGISKSTRPPFKLFRKDGPKVFIEEKVSPRPIDLYEEYEELKDKTAIEKRFKLFVQSPGEEYNKKKAEDLIQKIKHMFSLDFLNRGGCITIHIGDAIIAGIASTTPEQAGDAFKRIKEAYMDALLKDKEAFKKLKESMELGFWKELLDASNKNIDELFENIIYEKIDYSKEIKEAANLTSSEIKMCGEKEVNTDEMQFLIKAKFFEVMMIVNQSETAPITFEQCKWLGTPPRTTEGSSVHDFYFNSLMTGYTYQWKFECWSLIPLKMGGQIEVEDLYGNAPPKMIPIFQLEEKV